QDVGYGVLQDRLSRLRKGLPRERSTVTAGGRGLRPHKSGRPWGKAVGWLPNPLPDLRSDLPQGGGEGKVASYPPAAKSISSFMFRMMMTVATMAAMTVSQRGAVKAPILRRSAVNITRGSTAKGNCRLRITCD